MLFSARSSLRSRDLKYRNEPLATLGDSLALCRFSMSASAVTSRKFDVGAVERDGVMLIEVDVAGQRIRTESFACDRLGDAVVRLYERYAELLPEGQERDRAAATARSVAAMTARSVAMATASPGALEKQMIAPAIEFVDRRMLGTFSGRGAQELSDAIRSWDDVAGNVALSTDDVVDLKPEALLTQRSFSGTVRDSGGAFERPLVQLVVFGPDGRVTNLEMFDIGREEEALARFDELTAGPLASRATRRRVTPNAATAHAARLDASIAARDGDALPTLFAEESAVVDHMHGVNFDHEGDLSSFRSMLRARGVVFRQEPLATLGDSLMVCRALYSASGFVGRTFDVGAYELPEIDLVEVDASGKRLHTDRYALDRLGDAVGRLYERYAELLPEGQARDRAAATARAVATMTGALEARLWDPVVAPAIEFVDRRMLGTFSGRSAQELSNAVRSWDDVAGDVALSTDDVIDLKPDALLARRRFSGTVRASGGAFERPLVQLLVFGPDGRVTNLEMFDIGHEEEALARFDELTADSQ
jgi:hypothetical protein